MEFFSDALNYPYITEQKVKCFEIYELIVEPVRWERNILVRVRVQWEPENSGIEGRLIDLGYDFK